MPKIIAINGSPRKKGNTFLLLQTVLDELAKEGIETELINIGAEEFGGCQACYSCKKRADFTCKITRDGFNDLFAKCMQADGIILGSPVYVGGMTSQLKAFIDRACLVNKYNNEPLKRKLGAAVVAVRRNGALETFNAINNFFTLSQMIVVGASYWNQGIGRDKGEVLNDEEGIRTMINLAQNMSWLLHQLNKSQEKKMIPDGETAQKSKRKAGKKLKKKKSSDQESLQNRSSIKPELDQI